MWNTLIVQAFFALTLIGLTQPLCWRGFKPRQQAAGLPRSESYHGKMRKS